MQIHSVILLSLVAFAQAISVIVLGAGASGIFAAKQLKAAGIDVTILEARPDAIGGRMHKVEFPPKSGRFVELGANWIEGLGSNITNPVLPLVQKWGVNFKATDFTNTTYRSASGSFDQSVFQDRLAAFSAITEMTSELSDKRMAADALDISLRAGYRMAGWYPKDEIDYAIEWNTFDYEQAETPDVSSFEYTANIKTFFNYGGASDFIMDKRGYQYILEAEAAEFGCGYGSNCLKLNKTVSEIRWAVGNDGVSALDLPVSRQSPVKVTCKDGSVYTADYVISSFSLGVLQNVDVKFAPILPDWKIQSIHSFHMATYTKIFISFPSKFWTDNTEFIWYGATRRGEFTNWQVFDAAPYKEYFKGEHVLLCTVTDQVAFRIERQSDEQTKAELVQVLKNMYGPKVPNASAILVPRWNSDPLFRGSFTNWPIGMIKEEFDNLVAPINRLWFTGEHTSLEYFGYVHGAILAGTKTGNDVVKCIKNGCPKYPYHPVIHNAHGTTKFGKGERQ